MLTKEIFIIIILLNKWAIGCASQPPYINATKIAKEKIADAYLATQSFQTTESLFSHCPNSKKALIALALARSTAIRAIKDAKTSCAQAILAKQFELFLHAAEMTDQ